MFTRSQIIREFHRLCEIVNEAELLQINDEGMTLLDSDEARAMRDRYRERADAVLDAQRRQEKVRS